MYRELRSSDMRRFEGIQGLAAAVGDSSVEIRVDITAIKLALGGELRFGEFQFGLFEGNTSRGVGYNDTNGKIVISTFPLREGEYSFIIRELGIMDATPWVTDPREFPVEVSVFRGSDNLLRSVVRYPEGLPIFRNYSLNVDENGLIVFDCVEITEPGRYEFTIEEITDLLPPGWTAEESARFPVVIDVTDDGRGNLIPVISYPNGFPVFTNFYEPEGADVIIEAFKEVKNWNGPLPRFQFELERIYPDFDSDRVFLETNDSEGRVEFDIHFAETGTFRYLLREITPNGNGWITDSSVYEVTIEITDNGSGQLQFHITYDTFNGEPPVFSNDYELSPICIPLSAAKRGVGAELPEGKFEFGLFDEEGTQIRTAVNRNAQDLAKEYFFSNNINITPIPQILGCHCGHKYHGPHSHHMTNGRVGDNWHMQRHTAHKQVILNNERRNEQQRNVGFGGEHQWVGCHEGHKHSMHRHGRKCNCKQCRFNKFS